MMTGEVKTGKMAGTDADYREAERTERERQGLFLLNNVGGMYHGLLRKMYDYAGGFEEAYRIPAGEYLKCGILRNNEQGKAVLMAYDRRHEQEDLLMREYHGLSREGIRIVTIFDRTYPKRLSGMEDKPFLLYVRGRLPEETRPAAAVIGARRCSEYGRDCARYFASALSEAGVQVVSGMAAGIDGEAQRAALEASGESFGVLGSGVDICYPQENRDIYRRMAGGAGGVVSEFPRNSQALPFHFILRNRIIAGLCDVLLVLEAREKSGTGITVSNALDLGKDIFALPGRISDPLGRGCNALLKDGAMVLTSPEDVLSVLQIPVQKKRDGMEKDISVLANEEKLVYSCLDSAEQHIETLSERANMEISEMTDLLVRLELKGFCASVTQGCYRRL